MNERMVTMLHFERLVPTLYNIARSEDVDLGVADNMLQQCVMEGRAVYLGADGPGKFAPDYTALKAEYDRMDTEQEEPGANAEFNAFIKKRQAHYKELCDLWREGDCRGMVDLMATDDGEDYGIGEFSSTLEEALESAREPWADMPSGSQEGE